MRLGLLLIGLLLFTSCSSDDVEVLEFTDMGVPQKWELTQINLGLSGEIVKREELNISETYSFYPDGTFTKDFEDEHAVGTLQGSYELIVGENVRLLELRYSEEVGELSYCTQENAETLLISDNNMSLINGYCISFDGPAMYYSRIE